jgi:putative flippase GtrA
MSEAWRVMRFLATGVLNTAFSYACFLGLHWLGMPLPAAVALSTVMGVAFNFLSFGAFVFCPARSAAFTRFTLLYAAIAIVNYALLTSLLWLGVEVATGQAICLPALAAMSYVGMRFWVYAGPDFARQTDSQPCG